MTYPFLRGKTHTLHILLVALDAKVEGLALNKQKRGTSILYNYITLKITVPYIV